MNYKNMYGKSYLKIIQHERELILLGTNMFDYGRK